MLDKLNILSILISAAIGILVCHIYYRKSRHGKLLSYTILTQNLIHDSIATIDSLEILYNKQPISNLTSSLFIFGSRGNDTIHGYDFVNENPLVVESQGDTKILNAVIIELLSADNGFSLLPSTDGKSFTVTFDYLDKGEFATIVIFHTGKSNDDLKVMGRIRGGKIKEEKMNLKERLQLAWLSIQLNRSTKKLNQSRDNR